MEKKILYSEKDLQFEDEQTEVIEENIVKEKLHEIIEKVEEKIEEKKEKNSSSYFWWILILFIIVIISFIIYNYGQKEEN